MTKIEYSFLGLACPVLFPGVPTKFLQGQRPEEGPYQWTRVVYQRQKNGCLMSAGASTATERLQGVIGTIAVTVGCKRQPLVSMLLEQLVCSMYQALYKRGASLSVSEGTKATGIQSTSTQATSNWRSYTDNG